MINQLSYRSVRICTWKSSKLGSGRKAYFLSKLRRFFDYCSDCPEFILELVPSWDQDDFVAKNKGRQRASKSRMNFHIGGPHIQCIWTMIWSWYNRWYQWYGSDGSWMTHIDRKRDYESFSRSKWNLEKDGRDPRTADLVVIFKGGWRDPRTADLVVIFKGGSTDCRFGLNFKKGKQGRPNWSKFLKEKAGTHRPPIWSEFFKGSTDRRIGQNFERRKQGPTDRRFGRNFKRGSMGSRDLRTAESVRISKRGIKRSTDRRFGQNFKRGSRDPRTTESVQRGMVAPELLFLKKCGKIQAPGSEDSLKPVEHDTKIILVRVSKKFP